MGPRIPFAPVLLGIRIMCYSPLTIKRKFNLITILSYVNTIYVTEEGSTTLDKIPMETGNNQ